MKSAGALVLIALCLSAGQATAEGDMTRRAVRLAPLVLDARVGLAPDRYDLEAGVYYRLRIEGDGLEEYEITAPEFFSNIWIDRVEVEDMAIRATGISSIELGDAGAVDLWFIPIRPGTYDIGAEGLESQGFTGEIVVK